MRRLHIQFYLAILATLAVFVVASTVFWTLTGGWRDDGWSDSAVTGLVEGLLPPATAPVSEQRRVVEDLSRRLNMQFALFDASGQIIVAQGDLSQLTPRRLRRTGWSVGRGGPAWILKLEDGRHLAVRPRHFSERYGADGPGARLIIAPLSIVLAFALGAYPIARRLTRRLARLQTGVDQLGQGDLSTRVAVEGRDEVAALARSFNQSAERIQELVRSHKLLLANCSHELRTPLARIRLALERLTRDGADPLHRLDAARLHEELARSIGELDTLIGEMLLSSRLDALQTLEHAEEIDLLALAAEEAAHFDRTVEGQPAFVRGDPQLLRRLLRNLLDNARRHAGGATRIHVGKSATSGAELIVEDRGPGVPEAEREKIFEPFYRSPGAESSNRGFGLGLALVRQIARAHGGEARYEAPAEGGARFRVIVPSSLPAQQAAGEPRTS
jgi:signal transduction histidine kinase